MKYAGHGPPDEMDSHNELISHSSSGGQGLDNASRHSVKMPRLSDSVHIESHPASLSAALRGLFPCGALTAELRGAGDPRALYPEEARSLQKAVRQRIEEFAAGRQCARLLLREFGIEDCAIEVGVHRQPVWPEGLVGSITHTAGFCAAVAARRSLLRSVGIDTEVAGSVKPELWRGICTPAEIDLAALFAAIRARLGGDVDFLGQGGFLQMPIRLDPTALGIS